MVVVPVIVGVSGVVMTDVMGGRPGVGVVGVVVNPVMDERQCRVDDRGGEETGERPSAAEAAKA